MLPTAPAPTGRRTPVAGRRVPAAPSNSCCSAAASVSEAVPAAVGAAEPEIQRGPEHRERQQRPDLRHAVPPLHGGDAQGRRAHQRRRPAGAAGSRRADRAPPRSAGASHGRGDRTGRASRPCTAQPSSTGRDEEVERLAGGPAGPAPRGPRWSGKTCGPPEPMPPDRRREHQSRRRAPPSAAESARRPPRSSVQPPEKVSRRVSHQRSRSPTYSPAVPPTRPYSSSAPGIGVVRRARRADAEVAGRDDQHGEPPAPPGRDQAQARGHAGQVEQQQVGVGLVPAQQDRREERAQRGGDAERLDVDGVRDHGQRHRHQRQAHDAGGGRQHAVEPAGRPDAQVDDAGARSRSARRRRCGSVAEPPAERAHRDAQRPRRRCSA